MIGIGLVVLWLGYASFATGHAMAKGIPVTFTQMVLPSNRSAAIALVKEAQLGLNPNLLGGATLNSLAQPGGGGI